MEVFKVEIHYAPYRSNHYHTPQGFNVGSVSGEGGRMGNDIYAGSEVGFWFSNLNLGHFLGVVYRY